MHGPAEVDINGAPPFLVAERDERIFLGDTSIADEDVDLPEPLRGGGDCLMDLSSLGHVRLESFGLGPGCADEVHCLGEVVRGDVVSGDAGTLSGKRQCRGAADATGRTGPGEKHNLSVKLSGHPLCAPPSDCDLEELPMSHL